MRDPEDPCEAEHTVVPLRSENHVMLWLSSLAGLLLLVGIAFLSTDETGSPLALMFAAPVAGTFWISVPIGWDVGRRTAARSKHRFLSYVASGLAAAMAGLLLAVVVWLLLLAWAVVT